jgi:hypothetical protein
MVITIHNITDLHGKEWFSRWHIIGEKYDFPGSQLLLLKRVWFFGQMQMFLQEDQKMMNKTR